MIQFKGVSREYRLGHETISALNDVDLQIKSGEFVAIMGPSGSGKSTLANMIGGLDQPTKGTVVVDDQDLSRMKDKKLSEYRNKKVGFVFQTFNLQPNYTALENVMIPLIFMGMSPGKRKKRAQACLSAVGLSDRMNHRPGELSGGQRQRVCIARALANDPAIVIADEPTGNLDSKKSREIMELLRQLNREKEITLIVITHDPTVAKLADRVINIFDGKVK